MVEGGAVGKGGMGIHLRRNIPGLLKIRPAERGGKKHLY